MAKKNERIVELRQNLNETSKIIQSTIIVFILFLFFFLFIIMGTTPVQILVGTSVTMPIFNVSVTLTLFYAVAPFLLFLLHVYVVQQVAHVISLARAFHRELYFLNSRDDIDHERNLLFPFPPLMMLLNSPRRFISRGVAEFLTILAVGFSPPLVLLLCQAKFLAYHSEPITSFHRGLITADLLLVGTFGIWLIWQASSVLQRSLGRGAWVRILDLLPMSYTIGFVSVIFYLSWFIDRLPDPAAANDPPYGIKAAAKEIIFFVFPPNIVLPDNFVLADASKANSVKLDLADRHLEGLDANNPDFSGAHLNGTHLEGARLIQANFSGANLEDVYLSGAAMVRGDFDGATFLNVHAAGAFLDQSDFTASRIIVSQFEFASLRNTSFSGSYLWRNDFQGAQFDGSRLTGLFLSGDFTGTSFRNTQLTGIVPGFQPFEQSRKHMGAPRLWDEGMRPLQAGYFRGADFAAAAIGDVDFHRFDLSFAEGVPSKELPPMIDEARREALADLADVSDKEVRESAGLRLALAFQAGNNDADAWTLPDPKVAGVPAGDRDPTAAFLVRLACEGEWLTRGFVQRAADQPIPLSDHWRMFIEKAKTQKCAPLAPFRKAFETIESHDRAWLQAHPPSASLIAPESSGMKPGKTNQ